MIINGPDKLYQDRALRLGELRLHGIVADQH